MKDKFLVREDVTFLNFGSFGACPKEIFENYQQWQWLLEKEPVQFITVDGYSYMKDSRIALSDYLGCESEDLIFVQNPTYAINLIAKNLKLERGDEILTTNLEYGAMDRTWNYYCEQSGANYVRQSISLPLVSKEKFIEEFWKGFSERTKVIFISQITSSTALIFPVQEICEEAKRRGLITIVDGAHVPGHIPLNLKELKADFYTGACHKWMMAPKGCSFLYVKKEFQSMLDPLIISWGYKGLFPSESLFQDYHQFNGTRDFSAFLTIPACLEFMEKNNWSEVSATCKERVLFKGKELADYINTSPLAPLNDTFFGQMFSLPIKTDQPEKLQRLLFEKFRIEIPIMRHGNTNYIRFSMQAFNQTEEIDYLIESLERIRKETVLFERWT